MVKNENFVSLSITILTENFFASSQFSRDSVIEPISKLDCDSTKNGFAVIAETGWNI